MPDDIVSGVVFVVVDVAAVDAMIRLMPSREPGSICFVVDDGNAYAFQAQRCC